MLRKWGWIRYYIMLPTWICRYKSTIASVSSSATAIAQIVGWALTWPVKKSDKFGLTKLFLSSLHKRLARDTKYVPKADDNQNWWVDYMRQQVKSSQVLSMPCRLSDRIHSRNRLSKLFVHINYWILYFIIDTCSTNCRIKRWLFVFHICHASVNLFCHKAERASESNGLDIM